MSTSTPAPALAGGEMHSELNASLGTLLAALKAVAAGDLQQRLALKYPDTHPVGALALSINSMVEELAQARANSEGFVDELSEKIRTIESQREAIRTLSTPIIEVWTGVLCAPIVGVLDSMRAADVTTSLLTAVVDKRAKHAIIDVTGIEVMDTQAADHFLRMARSVTLLGAQCALSGVHPNIARTIVHMGVDLHGLKSYRTMRDALQHFVRDARRRQRARPEAT